MQSKENYLPEMLQIGTTLQDKRKSLNLSIEKAADLAGLEPRDIRNIENCEDIYNIELLIVYCKSIGIKINIIP